MDLITDILDILLILYPELNITTGRAEMDLSPNDLGLVSELMVNGVSIMWVYREGYILTNYSFPGSGHSRYRKCKTSVDKETYLHDAIDFFNKEMVVYSYSRNFKPIKRKELLHESKL